MYTTTNYKTKKELIAAFKAGLRISVYQPGPFGPAAANGRACIEGPHYPEPHRWYASVHIKDNIIDSIKK